MVRYSSFLCASLEVLLSVVQFKARIHTHIGFSHYLHHSTGSFYLDHLLPNSKTVRTSEQNCAKKYSEKRKKSGVYFSMQSNPQNNTKNTSR